MADQIISNLATDTNAPQPNDLVLLDVSQGNGLFKTEKMPFGQFSPRGPVNVLNYVVNPNGVSGNSAQIQACINAVEALGGGDILFPALGFPYIIDTGLFVPNGVRLIGAGVLTFPGSSATLAQWAADGTWFQPTDPVNPAVTLGGNGSALDGINFIWAQTVPTTDPYTPQTFPYGIQVNGTLFQVRNTILIGGSHGINVDFAAASSGGTFSLVENVYDSCLTIGASWNNINDVICVRNWQSRNLFYDSPTTGPHGGVVGWLINNKVMWDIHYWDNPMVDGIQGFQQYKCFQFTDGTVLGNTHSLYNAQLENVQLGLCVISMFATATSTRVLAQFGNLQAQSYADPSPYTSAQTLFQLGSDNVDITIAALRVADAGGQLVSLGNGVGGRMAIGVLDIQAYSTASAGQSGVVLAAGAIFSVGLTKRFAQSAGNGARYSGAGASDIITSCSGERAFFATFTAISITGTGSFADMTCASFYRPGLTGAQQARLVGSMYVQTPQANGVFSLQMGAITAIAQTGLAAAVAGYVNVDSGWIDIPQASLDAFSNFGRLQVSATSGVVIQNSELSLLWR